MNRSRKNFRRVAIAILMLAIFIVLLDTVIYGTFPSGGLNLLVIELCIGFVFFLAHNLPEISFDAGTWGPGIAAYLVALAWGHRFLSRWAARTNRPWRFATTFSLFLLLPVLFAISFLVPGVLLQWEFLRQGPWIQY